MERLSYGRRKYIRESDIDVGNSLTVVELISCAGEKEIPLIIKVGRKNFRVAAFAKKPHAFILKAKR